MLRVSRRYDDIFKAIHGWQDPDSGNVRYRTLLTADLKPTPPGEYGDDGNRVAEEDADEANLISSEVWAGEDKVHDTCEGDRVHLPCLDLDFPCVLVESSTPGHHHLYLNKPVAWDDYLDVLRAMANAGLIEEGYVHAAERRGATHLRLPDVQKGPEFTPTPDEPF